MYLKLIDGTPKDYSIGELKRDNPQTSFPSSFPDTLLADYGVYTYSRQEPPIYDPLSQKLEDGVFEKDEKGLWVLPWVVVPLPKDQAAANVRQKRDDLLSETDWIVIKAYELNQNVPVQWEVYRQALRDITLQEGFPLNVTWPTKP